MIWESTKRLAENIKNITAKADMTGENEIIINTPSVYCPTWTVGKSYTAGDLFEYKGVKYLVIAPITAQEHYPPDMANGAMLANYKPYQSKYGCEWLYGEYCEVGYTRYDNGILYKAIQNPNANIYPPSQVPAVWEVVE